MDKFKKTLRAKLDEAAQAAPERKRVMLYLDPDVCLALKAFATKRPHGSSGYRPPAPSPIGLNTSAPTETQHRRRRAFYAPGPRADRKCSGPFPSAEVMADP